MRDILSLLYVSALFAVVLTPLIRYVTGIHIGKWHPGRGLAIFFLFLLVAGAAVAFFAFALPPVLHDVQTLGAELPSRGPQLLERLHRIPLVSHLNLSGLNAKIQGFVSNFAEYLFLSISSWAGKLADVGAVIFLTIYFMLEGEEAYHWILSFFPHPARERLNKTSVAGGCADGQVAGRARQSHAHPGALQPDRLCPAQSPLRLCAGGTYGCAQHHSHCRRHGLHGPGFARSRHRLVGKSCGGWPFSTPSMPRWKPLS